MVIFIDSPTDSTEGIVTAREDIRHGKMVHTRSAGGLDNANIGNIVARQGIKFDVQLLHIRAFIVFLQDTIGNRAFFGFFCCYFAAKTAFQRPCLFFRNKFRTIQQIGTLIKQLDHDNSPLFVTWLFWVILAPPSYGGFLQHIQQILLLSPRLYPS